MGQRKNGVQHNSLKKINAVVMGKDGVGKSGRKYLYSEKRKNRAHFNTHLVFKSLVCLNFKLIYHISKHLHLEREFSPS